MFTVQQTFVDAEKLAQTMYSEEFANCIIDVSIYIYNKINQQHQKYKTNFIYYNFILYIYIYRYRY